MIPVTGYVTYHFYACYPVLLEFRNIETWHLFEISSPVFCGEGSVCLWMCTSRNLKINQVFLSWLHEFEDFQVHGLALRQFVSCYKYVGCSKTWWIFNEHSSWGLIMQSVDGLLCCCSRFGVHCVTACRHLCRWTQRILQLAALQLGESPGYWMSSVARGWDRLHVIFAKRMSLGAFAELRKASSNFVICVRSSEWKNSAPPPPPPQDGLCLNLIFGYFSEVCRGNSSFIKIWQ